MIPVQQTRGGGPDVPISEQGDCFAACISSVLEIPILRFDLGPDWWDNAQRAVASVGFRLVYFHPGPDERFRSGYMDEWLGDIYWIGTAPSLNLGIGPDGKAILHCLVMRGGRVAHDPSCGRKTYGIGHRVATVDAMLLQPLAV